MCIITVKGVFLQDSRKFIVAILWLLPVGAAHGTPFYSQHARLNPQWLYKCDTLWGKGT